MVGSDAEGGWNFLQGSPADAERRIANWIAAQEQPVSITQGEIDSQPKSPSMAGAVPPISVQAPVPASLAAERFENAQPSLSMGIPHRVVSESSQPAQFSNIASGLQWTTSPSPAIAFPTPEERFERPRTSFCERRRSVTKYFSNPRSQRRPKEIVPRDSLLPGLMPAPAKVIEVSHLEPQANDSAASELRQRRKLGLTVSACSAGILVLMVMIMSVSRFPARRNSNGRRTEPISSAAAVEPVNVPQTAPGPLTDQGAEADTPADAPVLADNDLLPILPTHLPASVPRDGDWGAHVESMLGIGVHESRSGRARLTGVDRSAQWILLLRRQSEFRDATDRRPDAARRSPPNRIPTETRQLL